MQASRDQRVLSQRTNSHMSHVYLYGEKATTGSESEQKVDGREMVSNYGLNVQEFLHCTWIDNYKNKLNKSRQTDTYCLENMHIDLKTVQPL